MRLRPVKILPLMRSDGSVFWEFYIKVKCMRILDDFIRKAEALGCRIIHMDVDVKSGSYIDVRGLIDTSMSAISINTLIKNIADSQDILNFEIYKSPFRGLGIYSGVYPPMMGKVQVVILRALHFSNILNSLKDKWGSAGEVVLYYIGEMAGYESYEILSKCSKLRGLELIKFGLILGRSYGWWRDWELSDFDWNAKQITIRLFDLVECRYVKREKQNSQFMRGLLSGFISKVYGLHLMANEVSCIARGDDCCEFRLKPAFSRR